MPPTSRIPTHPGEVLREEFVEPLKMSTVALADHLRVPASVVEAVLSERAAVTPDLAWRLSMAIGTTAQFWMNLQSAYDLATTRPAENIPPIRSA